MQYRYGDSWERFPIEPGEVWGLPNGSRVAVHDLFDPLPAWMRADLLFVDLPYNEGQLRGYYAKADLSARGSFGAFADALWRRIDEIGARTVYCEIGNQYADDWFERLRSGFHYAQQWPVTYYRKYPTNLLRCSHIGPTPDDYTGLDEARCIELLAQREMYDCLADPCMGRGLAGLAAYKAGRRFVGTELNKRRLAVLLDKLAKRGAAVGRVE